MKKNNKNNTDQKNTQTQEMSIEEMALALTKSVIVKRGSSKKSMNDYLLDCILDNPMERTAIVAKITLVRLNDKDVVVDFENQDFIELYIKETKTVKNGVDTSISKSNNNSSFSYNKKYEDYTLTKQDDGRYVIKLNK